MTKWKARFSITLILLAVVAAGGWWYWHDYTASQEQHYETALQSGINAFNAKNYTQAIGELQQVPSAYGAGWHARYYEGSAHILLKDYEAAAPLLEEALSLNPANTRIMHALGVTYFKLGKLGLSKGYFAQVLEIDPTDAEARGLMDIMANLERMQPGQSPKEQPDED